MYGSSFSRVMSSPRFSSSAPIDAEAIPLPRELTTPPVTKMNLVFLERMTRDARCARGTSTFQVQGRLLDGQELRVRVVPALNLAHVRDRLGAPAKPVARA